MSYIMKYTALSTPSHIKPEIRANHHYDDGNVLLCVDNAHFRVHASILRLSSSYFENLLPEFLSEIDLQNNNFCPHQDYTATGANAGIIACVRVDEANPGDVELLLSTLYLHTEIEITWKNVETILKLAHRYHFPRILRMCDLLLARDLKETPLEVLLLADKYLLPRAYRDSSALVIEDYAKLSRRQEYKQLSLETRVEIQAIRLRFIDGVNELSQYESWTEFQCIQNPQCGCCFQQLENKLKPGCFSLSTSGDFSHLLCCLGCSCGNNCSGRMYQHVKEVLGMSDASITVCQKEYKFYIEISKMP